MVDCNPKASAIVYDSFAMDSTAVTEFRLVCGEQYKVEILSSRYFGIKTKN